MARATQMTTGKVRFSYVHVFEKKRSMDGQEAKYSVTLLIPKTDTATKQKIDAAIAAAKVEFAERNNGKSAQAFKATLHDGDGERPAGGEYGPECKGCWVITCQSKNQPVAVYADKTPIVDPNELYSGCYGKAVINFFAFSGHGNTGVTAGLNGVMKLHDGDPLAGGVVTDADWDDDETGMLN